MGASWAGDAQAQQESRQWEEEVSACLQTERPAQLFCLFVQYCAVGLSGLNLLARWRNRLVMRTGIGRVVLNSPLFEGQKVSQAPQLGPNALLITAIENGKATNFQIKVNKNDVAALVAAIAAGHDSAAAITAPGTSASIATVEATGAFPYNP